MVQPAAIPPIVMAAILSYVGVFHLVVWLRTRRGRVDLSFALACLCTALYDLTCAGLYDATSVQEGLPWTRWQRLAVALAGAAFAWFVADYTGRLPRRALGALAGFGLCYALVMALVPHWGLSGEPSVKVVFFPWSEPISYYEMGVRPIGFVLEAYGVLLFVASFIAAARQFRAGERSRARPLMLALGVLAAGVANDIAVSAGILRTPYSIEYAFLALVVLMAFSLMDEVLRADRAERVVRENQARYRNLVEGTEDLVLQLDQSGTISFANRGAARALGIPSESLIGMAFADILPPGERELHERMLQDWRGGGEDHALEARHEGAGGRVLDVLWRVTAITDPSDGSQGFNAIGRDVTRLRAAGAERRMLSAAIEQTGEIVIVTNAQGTIEYVNPAFEQVTGFSRAEAIGRTPAILKSGEHEPAFYRELWETIRSGRSWRGRLTNRRKDGTLYVEDAVISPVRDDAGWVTHYVGVMRDISAAVQLQERLQQAEKLEAIGMLAGGIAHDFNNLLTPILGYAELLEMQSASADPSQAAIREIHRAAADAQRLTEQLLTFGRKQRLEPSVIDLGELVARASQILRRAIREDVEIVITRGDEPSQVKVDVQQIEQVLMNLAVNAQDAMPTGGRMQIDTRTTAASVQVLPNAGPASGTYAVLSVTDDGTGMDAETQARLFEPFFTTKETGRGTGLGLATTYGIVKQHGGWIEASSELGRGSRFEVYLPLTSELAQQASPVAEHQPARGGHETILVAEDNALVRKLTEDVLKTHGYRVLTAESGEAALARAEAFAGPIQLLLTDVIMPGMSGRELSERLVATRPEVRVLFMSGHPRDVIAPQGILEERVELVAKPFRVATLTAKVREILDR
jgi:PAS domain S-box-containing protein